MFKKFEDKEHISGVNNMKSSVQRGVRAKILEGMPHIENYIDGILPKKEGLKLVKCHEHIEMVTKSDGEVIFFRQRDGPYYPTLKLLHKYPFLLPHMQVDKGAIKFVLSGANIMSPGLTSPGAKMTQVKANTVVAVMAEGKQHALAVAVTKMSTDEILEINKGVALDNIHYLMDGLWHIKAL